MSEQDHKGDPVRSIKDSPWYWGNKSLLHDYAKDIGALGIAVYDCLASFVDAKQTCYPTQEQIGQILGYSRVSINKAIKLLQHHDLIVVDKRRRHNCVYRLPKVRCKETKRQVLNTGTLDVKPRNTNENHLPRLINDPTLIHNHIASESKDPQPAIQSEPLALEMADALNDHAHLSLYLSLARKHPESLLRAALGDALAVPEGKIRKSRTALFIHLIGDYEKQQNHNPNY